MASKFVFPGGAFDELPPRGPEPPPSSEEVEASDARVNDLKNLFIAAKQHLLFSGPQAFLRQQGADAIAGAGDASEALVELRRHTLDEAANTPQRARLAEMLDWHLADATDEIHRHVAQQSTVWQQDVAARTVVLATKQAALEAGDTEKVGFLALAAHDAERMRALKAGLPPAAADESARIAWSSAYKAAIDAQAVNDPPQAVTLFKQAQYTLDPQTRDSLAPRMEALSRNAQAGALADKALAIGADRKALLEDPAIPPEVRQLAESRIADREAVAAANRKSQIDTLDRRLGSETPQALASNAYVPGTYAAIADGYAAAGDAEKAAGTRHLAANETMLTGFAAATPANQALRLARLEPGAVRDQALRIKDATDRLLADDPLRWGTTVQRANGVGELAPLDLLPSPTNTPQAIAAALAGREQQARHSEALSGRPTLAMTRAELAAFKTTLDAAPLESKQKMLRRLADGLSESATARLALELAQQGPLADGYAIALSTYGARLAEQDALADRILDGLSRMKAAGEGGKPVADTGPKWRRAFDENIANALPHLDEVDAATLRAAAAALYTQSMALKGKDGKVVDGDELDGVVRDVLYELISDQVDDDSSVGTLSDIAAEVARLAKVAIQPELDFYQRSLVDPLRYGLTYLAQSPLGDPGLYASFEGLGPPGMLPAAIGSLAAKGLRGVVGLGKAEGAAEAAAIAENVAHARASKTGPALAQDAEALANGPAVAVTRAEAATAKELRAKQLAINKEAGAAFYQAVGAWLRSKGLEVGEEITVMTASGKRVRLDFITRDPITEELQGVEAKASLIARLTRRQREAFPEIEQSGGTVVGVGKKGFPNGTKLLPGKIKIIRGPNLP